MESHQRKKTGDVYKRQACDCATVLNKQQALDIKNAGYTHGGRYLTGSVGKEHTPKYLTSTEVKNIENAGLSVFPIYSSIVTVYSLSDA